MATHSSTLAWKIPWMEKPVGLQSMGSHTQKKSRTRLSDFTSNVYKLLTIVLLCAFLFFLKE